MGFSGTQLELHLTPNERRASYRSIVLTVINANNEPMHARTIAQHARLTYRQTVDALNALYNFGKIDRIGRKFTARWSRKNEAFTVEHGLTALERHFLGIR